MMCYVVLSMPSLSKYKPLSPLSPKQREMEYFVDMVLNWRCEPEEDLRRHVLLEKVTTGAEISWKLGREVKISEVDELRKVLEE